MSIGMDCFEKKGANDSRVLMLEGQKNRSRAFSFPGTISTPQVGHTI